MATAAKKPAPAAKTTQVAVKPTPVDDAARPSFLKDGQRGSENVGSSDMVIPRLEIVQSISPARKKGDAAYIEGADEGMLFNNVTRELYGEDVTVVPVYFTKEWLIWKDRKKGGGFRGAFPNKTDAEHAIRDLKDSEGKPENPADFEALDTAQHFCLLLQPGKRPQQIVLSMSRSKMKISRKWNSMIALSGDDSFARKYTVEGVQDQNANGDDYYNLKVSGGGFVTKDIYTEAEKLYLFLKSGSAKVDHNYEGDEPAAAAGSSANAEF